MTETLRKADLIKLPVSSLEVGMFVSAIENSQQLTVANAGRITQLDLVTKLKSKGVQFVWIDPARSTFTAEKVPANSRAAISPPTIKNREQAQKQASELLHEAKGLVRKVLSETFEGKAIEVAKVEALAENMIESVMDNADAFKCVSALRTKDAYLLEHSVNVAVLLVTFGRYLGLERDMLRQLAVGGILHDVGKIKVDSSVLNKPGKLTPEEFEHMKLHQVYAIPIMSEAQGLSQVSRDVCLMHHEKLDGRGYPRGLKGEQLPQHGRMSCIVDIYDALTATRCYKEAMSPAAAFKILLSLTPFHLDESLVYEFIRCIGVYPVGSLVELSDGRVGIVWETEGRDVLHPVVKCFYSNKHKHYTDVVLVDLKKSDLNIERGISPSAMAVDPTPFY
ncbi:HD-GYP domain-containing protein [Shewanella yunxiaonensis]|uniref:HD-GYP domain-containing protein n=1 Tax=Shewanella yunxiaonensis TaxID=2829809 RepID=A0ABX7YT90_9GAMM|nr:MULTISPECIES: HD-GYP domain-containing protein [Shewanella]MDF0534624.1 HD-GYP domain-containing protein [Shewanella sp. A32]QUN06000.1 HD-GYP domain-containing protein [Shewanella yunxiaonensis]